MLERLTDHPDSVSEPGYGRDKSAGRGYDGERWLAAHTGCEINRESYRDHIDYRYGGVNIETKTVACEDRRGQPGRCRMDWEETQRLVSKSPGSQYAIVVIDPEDTRVLRWFLFRAIEFWRSDMFRSYRVNQPTWRRLHDEMYLIEDWTPES